MSPATRLHLLPQPRSLTRHAGQAVLAGTDGVGQGAILLSNARGSATDFEVTIGGWPWPGKAVVKCHRLDHDRDLELADTVVLADPSRRSASICHPRPCA